MSRTDLLPLLALALAIGCNHSSSTSPAKPSGQANRNTPLQVAATVGMVADVARIVGGEHVQVKQICGSGVDPHLYKATRDDVKALMAADLIFYSGLMLEGKMTDTLIKMARRKPVIALTESLDESTLLEPEDFAGHSDPHVWMDVTAWAGCVDVVRDALTEAQPEAGSEFSANAATFQDQLAQLHTYGLETIATVPESSRILLTSHDAFNYFGRAYGLEVLGVQGLSTESEAGLQRINDLVDLLVEKDIKAVFVESSVSSKNIKALVEGAKARGHEVRIWEKELFSDAMGESGSYEGTYIGMLDHNITQVVIGLGGQAPQSGLNGKLAN